jgi:hypothetical protein
MADEQLETRPVNVGIERPAFIKPGHRGTEHITKDDLQIARLALAQGLTPMVAEGKMGVNLKGEETAFTTGVMFNSMSEVIYGKGPLEFFVIRCDKPRWIEFIPREQGGGVKDMNVPATDPRTRFTMDPVTGKSIKPVATKFYDFIIGLLPFGPDPMKNIISLSFKSSGLKMARQLNTLIAYRNADLFAGVYRVTSIVDPDRRKGIFNSYSVENAGWITDESFYRVAEGLFTSLADKTIGVDRTGADVPDSPDDFNPGDLESQPLNQSGEDAPGM